MKKVVVLFILVIFPNLLQAQSPVLEKLDLGLGNTNTVVKKIELDQAGYLWLLTNGGFYRYNGNYSEAVSDLLFPVNALDIVDIKVSSKGLFLITSKKLVHLNTSSWEIDVIYEVIHPQEEIKLLEMDAINQTLFLSTNLNNLVIIHENSEEGWYKKPLSLNDLAPPSTFINKLNSYENRLYISCSKGLVIEIDIPNLASHYHPLATSKSITSCFKIEGEIYAEVFEEGIFNLSSFEKNNQIPDNFFEDVHILKVTDKGFFGFSKQFSFQLNKQEISLLDCPIQEHLTDLIVTDDLFYISSVLGVYRLDFRKQLFTQQYLPEKFLNKSTRSIFFTTQGDLWVSTYSGSYFKEKDSIYYFDHINYATEEVDSLNLYLGSEGQGVYVFNKKNKTITQASQINPFINLNVRQLKKHNHILYIGTQKGLYKHCLTTGNTHLISGTKALRINRITTDKEGVYISTNQGFYKLEEEAIQLISNYNKEVYSHLVEKDHFILGTKKDGVVVLDKTSQHIKHQISTANQLNSNIIYEIIRKDALLYVFTQSGLSLLNQNFSPIPLYNFKNNTEFNHNAIAVLNGELYLGNLDGWVKVNTQMIENYVAPNTFLYLSAYTVVKKNENQKHLVNKAKSNYEIKLPSSVNSIRLEFSTSVNSKNPSNFYFNLPESNKSWQEFNANEGLILSNLKPRWNKFLVSPNQWDKNASTISIYRTPFFYETYWFYSITIVFILGLGYAIIYYLNFLTRTEYRIKEKIAKDLHDEVGSQLSTISLQSEFVKYNKDKNDQIKYLESIKDTSKEAINSLNQIVWSFKHTDSYWNDFVVMLKQYANSFFENTNTEVVFINQTDLKRKIVDDNIRHEVLMMYKEILNNCHKHAKATQLRIEVRQNKDQVMLNIVDNGIGFTTENIGKNTNGVNNIKARAKNTHIGLKTSSAPNKGTYYTLFIPINRAFLFFWKPKRRLKKLNFNLFF